LHWTNKKKLIMAKAKSVKFDFHHLGIESLIYYYELLMRFVLKLDIFEEKHYLIHKTKK
jgi:hypothetical protein